MTMIDTGTDQLLCQVLLCLNLLMKEAHIQTPH